MTRKEELQQELSSIENKEMEARLTELNHIESSVDSQLKLGEAKSHRIIMYGDFAIKLLVAAGVTAAFMYVVVSGNMDAMESPNTFQQAVAGGNGNFQLLQSFVQLPHRTPCRIAFVVLGLFPRVQLLLIR